LSYVKQKFWTQLTFFIQFCTEKKCNPLRVFERTSPI